jgi:hypothetical protein
VYLHEVHPAPVSTIHRGQTVKTYKSYLNFKILHLMLAFRPKKYVYDINNVYTKLLQQVILTGFSIRSD